MVWGDWGNWRQSHYVISENEDCENGVDGDIENVETDIFYKISHEDSDGEWKFLERVYSRPSSLTEGEHHKESAHFTVPPEAKNMRVYFKAKADATGEVNETDEGNNWSYWQKEWYPVKGDTDLTIAVAQVVGQAAKINLGSKYRFEMAVQNIGADTPLVGIQSGYYLKKPGESNFTLIEEDGSDAGELTPGRDQYESVENDNIKLGDTGTRTLKVCADYQGAALEINEGNNCSSISFKVK